MEKKSNDITLGNLLKKAIEKFIPFSRMCSVVSVDNTTNTCICEPLDGGSYYTNVRLSASETANQVVYPVVDSMVIISFLEDNQAFVAMYSKIDKIRHNSYDEKEKEQANLYSMTKTLIDSVKTHADSINDSIKKMQLNTSQGPTVPVPINVAEFDSATTILNDSIKEVQDSLDILYQK